MRFNMTIIKPCPFCGCEYSKDDFYSEDFWYTGDHEAWCPLANIGTFGLMISEDDIENWNRRFADGPT